MDENRYLVGAYIVGRTGRKVEVTEFISAPDRDIACAKMRELIEEEGWEWGGIDFVDWSD